METAATDLRNAFWTQPPVLPGGLALERQEPIVVTRVGRSGAAVYDLVHLRTPTTDAPLIAAYQTRLLAGHIAKIKSQLLSLVEQHNARQTAHAGAASPAVITDAATPSVIESCSRQSVALFDQRGTCVVNTPSVVVYVVGTAKIERPSRTRLFSGRASRVVRFLLSRTAFDPAPTTAQALATACELSYAYTHGVLAALEKRGLVERKSARSGFRLRDPVGLLRSWIDSGEQSAVVTEGFYCPTTTPFSLHAAAVQLTSRTGARVLFTLASALRPEEIHVAALPHGIYWNGELQQVVDAFALKRKTPHNFLVLRPDPLLWTSAGGLLLGDDVHHDSSLDQVSLPQVAADFATLSGRGKDQAQFLVSVYAKRLPYQLDDG